MNLIEFYNKKVRIVNRQGKEWTGEVEMYFYPEDNESGEESIALRCDEGLIEFPKSHIITIEII